MFQLDMRHRKHHACTVIDGCALLVDSSVASIHLDAKAISEGLCEEIQTSYQGEPGVCMHGDVYLTDMKISVRSLLHARISRMTKGCKVFQLCPTAPLPSQKVTLTITQNKKQLIDIICKDLHSDTDFHGRNTGKHKLVITGQEETPVEISCGGVVIQRRDIATTHEEADNIIVR